MRRLALFWLIYAIAAGLAQAGAADRPVGQEKALPLGYRYVASQKDIYCAGFVTHEQFSRENFVVGGRFSPEQTRFGPNETVFLSGSGYEPGVKYAVIRDVRDPNRYEYYKGQNKALEQLGHMYAEIALVTVTSLQKGYAIATVNTACQPLVPGDMVMPARDKGSLVIEPRTVPFSIFGVALPKRHGKIVMSNDFDSHFGTRKAVYINLGSKTGLAPGNYLRISRSYNPATMPESNRVSLAAPQGDDTQRKPIGTPISSMKRWPLRGIGELVVVSVTPDSATCLVSMALEDVQVGDLVAPEMER
jgi:hypothetical protein